MKFDDFLHYIGEFGPFQRRVYMQLCLPLILSGMQIMNPVFILHVPYHRCAIPGLDNDTYAIQGPYHQSLVDRYIPAVADKDDIGGSQYSKCTYYDILVDIQQVNGTEDSILSTNASHPTANKRACSKWVYDQSEFISTVTSEENLVCKNAIYTAHATTALSIGSMLGFILNGFISDRFGRKKAYMLSVLVLSVFTVLCIWVPNIYVFIVMRFFIGYGFGAFFNGTFVYVMEFVGPSRRIVLGILINNFWGVGLFIHAGLGYGLRNWRHLQLATGLPHIPVLLYWWFLPESTRWLLAEGHYKKGRQLLDTMLRTNKVKADDGAFAVDADTKPEGHGSFIDLFRNRRLCLTTIVVFLNWMMCSMTYYGLSLNVGNLAGNMFLNYLLTTLVEFVGYLVCIPALAFIGRKALHSACMISTGVALLCVIFPQVFKSAGADTATLILALFGKFGSSAAFAAIYLWSAELFPTVVRSAAMGASAVCSALGAIIAPYIISLALLIEGQFSQILPLVVFGASSIAVGALALLLPETRNRHMPDDIHDMKTLSRSGIKKRSDSELEMDQTTNNKY